MFDEIPNHRWMFGVGGDYEGFRYATEQEGIDLILAIGWTGSPALVSNVESVHAFDANNEAKDIMDLIGRTRIVSSRQSSTFLTSTAVDDDLRVLRVTDRHSSGVDSVDSETTRPKGRDLPFLGSLLVRSSSSSSSSSGGIVPEPSSLTIFGVAGLGLLVARRRR